MIKKIAILANGGDVSGFNAVIRAIVRTAENSGVECIGFLDGYRGLVKNNYIKLESNTTASGILAKGGSIISSSTISGNIYFKPIFTALFIIFPTFTAALSLPEGVSLAYSFLPPFTIAV